MDSIPIEPLHDIVLLAPDEPTQQSGNFLLRDEDGPGIRRGQVVAVGPGRFSDRRGEINPMHVQVGQHVLVAETSGVELQDGGRTYLAISNAEILFVDRR